MESLLQIYVRLITPEGNQLLVNQRIDLSQREPAFSGGPEGQNRGWRKRTRPRDFTTTNPLIVPHRGHRRSELNTPPVSTSSIPTQKTFQATNWRKNPGKANLKRDAEWKPYR